LEEEYKQILKDRDSLRNVILKTYDDYIHMGVNVSRILLNAKEKFEITDKFKTNLKPGYVMEQLSNLMSNLSPIPGITVRKDQLLTEANENSTWLFRIYLR
jgi:DNA-directed RNA polymerase II subunit RPB1